MEGADVPLLLRASIIGPIVPKDDPSLALRASASAFLSAASPPAAEASAVPDAASAPTAGAAVPVAAAASDVPLAAADSRPFDRSSALAAGASARAVGAAAPVVAAASVVPAGASDPSDPQQGSLPVDPAGPVDWRPCYSLERSIQRSVACHSTAVADLAEAVADWEISPAVPALPALTPVDRVVADEVRAAHPAHSAAPTGGVQRFRPAPAFRPAFPPALEPRPACVAVPGAPLLGDPAAVLRWPGEFVVALRTRSGPEVELFWRQHCESELQRAA